MFTGRGEEEGTPRLSAAYLERRPRTAARATIWRPDQYMTCAVYRESLIALRGIWGVTVGPFDRSNRGDYVTNMHPASTDVNGTAVLFPHQPKNQSRCLYLKNC